MAQIRKETDDVFAAVMEVRSIQPPKRRKTPARPEPERSGFNLLRGIEFPSSRVELPSVGRGVFDGVKRPAERELTPE